jgi:hypothetical protein
MNLKDLVATPKLIKITVNDDDIVKKYGEPLDFWTWDRQPMDTFLKVAGSGSDYATIIEVVKDLVVDEDGNRVIKDGMTLPSDVLINVVNKIIEVLGK